MTALGLLCATAVAIFALSCATAALVLVLLGREPVGRRTLADRVRIEADELEQLALQAAHHEQYDRSQRYQGAADALRLRARDIEARGRP